MLHSPKHIHKLHTKKKKKASDLIILLASIVYPLTTLPQVFEIFDNRSATNISLLTYVMYMFFTIVFFTYGVRERLMPIIVLQSLWFIMYGLIVLGILIFR